VTEMSEPESKSRAAKAANLFDLRRIIGGLFVVYGILLTVLGLFDSQEEIDKAAGVNINLWAGLGMLAVGLLFIAWALWRPLSEELASDEPGGGPGDDRERPGGGGDARPE
jgi:xanthine/uracil/vitamin C permease (AzgA family)